MAAAVLAAGEPSDLRGENKYVAVVPDVSGIDRAFHYSVPDALTRDIGIGSIVRVPLRGRKVRGWVTEVFDKADATHLDVELRDIERIVSLGPPEAVVELCRYGSWRYAGPMRSFLLAASPSRIERSRFLPKDDAEQPDRPAVADVASTSASEEALHLAMADAFSKSCSVLRVPPVLPRQAVIEAVLSCARDDNVLILVPEHHDAEVLSERLERASYRVARSPRDWGKAAAGGHVVIGTRNAVWSPMAKVSAILVLDAHAEAYVSERAPTWNASVIAKERALRAHVPCVLVSPCPSLELLAMGDLVCFSRADERSGWPKVEILDRRKDDPRTGLYAEGLASILRDAVVRDPNRSAICVLNRKGRARLLACGSCGELARCEHCGAALAQVVRASAPAQNELVCPRCSARRGAFCASCASLKLKTLRVGVTRAREELAALTGLLVSEVTGTSARQDDQWGITPQVLVGTEAVLHRVQSASVVVFLDFDQELLAPRFRAGEEALALLARAARLVGTRRSGPHGDEPWGKIVVQTRLPDHDVLTAARKGDPGFLNEHEAPARNTLELPPDFALALLSGDGAAALAKEVATRPGCEVLSLGTSRFVLRAKDHASIADALRECAPGDKVRIEVDPIRI